MQLKTFSASTMAQALAEVKKDLGKDAVILHTRVYRVGAVMGMGGRQVVEITASDSAEPRVSAAPTAGRRALAGPVASGSPADDRESPVAVAGPRPLAPSPIAPPPIAMEQFQPAVFQRRRTRPASGAPAADPGDQGEPDAPFVRTRGLSPGDLSTRAATRPSPLSATPAPLAPVDAPAVAALKDELATIRRMMGEVLHSSRRRGEAPSLLLTDPMRDLAGSLASSGLPPELADATLEAVRDGLTPDERTDPDIVRRAAITSLAKRLPTIGGVTRHEPGAGRPLTIALVGPTGVGKTTTVAKLAAVYKLRHGKRVGLVTADTYRIAAVDQLRTYAQILSIPLRVALTPGEMRESLSAMRDCEVVLVDSAGRSPHDTGRLSELAAFVEAAAPAQTHLVLSAAADAAVLRRAVERFTSLGPDRLLLTKLDEAVLFGAAAGLVSSIGLPVHYVTQGQEVPDHIELADSDRLARLVLDPDSIRRVS